MGVLEGASSHDAILAGAQLTSYDGVVKVYNEDPSVCEKGLRVMIDERKQALKINREVAVSEVADAPLAA